MIQQYFWAYKNPSFFKVYATLLLSKTYFNICFCEPKEMKRGFSLL